MHIIYDVNDQGRILTVNAFPMPNACCFFYIELCREDMDVADYGVRQCAVTMYLVPAQHARTCMYMYPKAKLILINSIRWTLSGSCSAFHCAAASTGLVYSHHAS